MDARGGVSTYHNVATQRGQWPADGGGFGIPGANLDEFTSGMTRIEVQNGWSNPFAGYSPSLPWDRGETTLTMAVTMTKLWGNHTIKFGGDYRHNEDYLLQTQDQGGPRGRFQFSASQTGSPAHAASQTNLANSFAAFLLDRPSNVSRDLAVIDKPGTVYSVDVHVRPRQVAGRTEDDRSTLACATSTTRRSSASSARADSRTTTRSPTRCSSPATAASRDNLTSSRTGATSIRARASRIARPTGR